MRRTKEESELTRTAILDAAERIFCEQGYAVATIDGVSRAAGVTRGAFYWHFKDKADLLGALYARSLLPQEQILTTAAEMCSDPLRSLLDAGVASLREFEVDEGKQRMFRIMSDLTIGCEGRANLARIDAELDALILRVMTRAEDEGMLHEDFSAADAAVFVSVTIGGLLHQWLRSGKTFPLAALGETLLRRHVAMLRGTDRDPPRAGPATEPA